MSDCRMFADALLEGDPEVLRGEGDSPLATHLRSCPACRRKAAVLLEETAALDAALAVAVDAAAVDAVLRRVSGEPSSPAGRALARRLPRRWTWSAATLAAAALAGVLLLRGPSPPTTAPVSPAASAPPPVLADASARRVAVLQTDNPDITVLWFFQEDSNHD